MSNEILDVDGAIAIKDGVSGVTNESGWMKFFVDSADGKLKVIFGNNRQHVLAGPKSSGFQGFVPSSPWGVYDYLTYNVPQAVLDPVNRLVNLNGAVAKSSSGANVIDTLPSDYHPDHKREFVCPCSISGTEYACRISIDTNGDMTWEYTYGVGAPVSGDTVDWILLTPICYVIV